jgi:hypothetical protein
LNGGFDSVLEWLVGALNRIVAKRYVIDILDYTIINNNWGIGVRNYKYLGKDINYRCCY